MSQVNKALLRGVTRLREEARRGSPEASSKLMELRARALEGDRGAEAAINTFAVLHFQEQHPEQWEAVRAIREGFMNRTPSAIGWVSDMKSKAKVGDEDACRAITMLNAHSRAQALSAWAHTSVEDEDGNTRVRNHTTMILGHRPNSSMVGSSAGDSTSAVKQSVRKFLALTPDKEKQLIAMMLRGAASRGSVGPSPDSGSGSGSGSVSVSSSRGGSVSAKTRHYTAPKPYLALGRVKAAPKALGFGIVHMSQADQNATRADQQGICEAAASAKARNSPAAPGLIAQCAARRREAILAGLFVGDKFTANDPALRVALTDAGDAIVLKNPKMEAFRRTLPGTRGSGQQRGFTMAMAVRAGNVDAKFIEFIKPGLAVDPELLKGFLDGMAM